MHLRGARGRERASDASIDWRWSFTSWFDFLCQCKISVCVANEKCQQDKFCCLHTYTNQPNIWSKHRIVVMRNTFIAVFNHRKLFNKTLAEFSERVRNFCTQRKHKRFAGKIMMEIHANSLVLIKFDVVFHIFMLLMASFCENTALIKSFEFLATPGKKTQSKGCRYKQTRNLKCTATWKYA